MKTIAILAVAAICGSAQASTYASIDDNGWKESNENYVSHTTLFKDESLPYEDTASFASAETSYGHNSVFSFASIFYGGYSSATSVWTDHFAAETGTLSAAVRFLFDASRSHAIDYTLVMYSSEMTVEQIISAADSGYRGMTVLVSSSQENSYGSRIFEINTPIESDFYIAGILRSSSNSNGYANFSIQTPGVTADSGTIYPTVSIPEPAEYSLMIAGVLLITAIRRRRSQ